MPKQRKTIGIIGGMGPAATVDFMQRIVLATPAKDDSDHLRILVDNNPHIPSRIAALIEKTGESPAPMMIQTALGLERQGADILAIPCNTAHYYYQAVAEAVSVPLLNMIDLAAQRLSQNNPVYKKVGLLASTALQLTQLYETYCQQRGVEVIYPSAPEQNKVMNLIKAVKSNQHHSEQVDDYYQVANNLRVQGADCLLVACTELSVIGFEGETVLPHFDALDILVEEIVRIGLST
ncbi:MAG: aspartate racemase [Gammaproteobacteria bacterium]|nr:MAG: aspartate racemase [Gammaproteobacteria bacterium]